MTAYFPKGFLSVTAPVCVRGARSVRQGALYNSRLGGVYPKG